MSRSPGRQHRETYTRQRPDGTVETTTTQVRTKYVEEGRMGGEWGCGPGMLNTRYCARTPGIVRIAEIVVGLLVLILVTSVFGPGPFKNILFGQTLLLIFTAVAIVVTFCFLVAYFLNLHNTHLYFWPWNASDYIFSVIAVVVFTVLGIAEIYYATGAWANNCNDIGGDGVIHNGCRFIYEWLFAALFCFALALLYAVSATFAHRQRGYE